MKTFLALNVNIVKAEELLSFATPCNTQDSSSLTRK